MNLEESVRIGGKTFRPMLSPGEIASAVQRLAAEIDRDYPKGGEPPLLLCVLKGAALFCADLMRELKRPVTLDFIRISSYGDRMTSGPSLTFTAFPGTEIRGRNVIVVEDIVDSGRTLRALREYLREEGAASVGVATLLYKSTGENLGTPPEYVGFDIDDRFVVGYGLDYAEEGRDLSAIYVLSDPEDSTPEEQ